MSPEQAINEFTPTLPDNPVQRLISDCFDIIGVRLPPIQHRSLTEIRMDLWKAEKARREGGK